MWIEVNPNLNEKQPTVWKDAEPELNEIDAPIDYFRYFLYDENFDNIATQSNLYSCAKRPKQTPKCYNK